MNILERHVLLFRAIKSLRPGAQFTLFEDESIQWDDKIQTQPSLEEIEDEIVRLVALDESTEYQRLRRPEYPPIGDQLDALWKGGEAAAAMLAQIQAVKDMYPKE
jgi:hypothetical protein